MKVIIDRIEGCFAVVEMENGKFANLPVELVPDANEGDVVSIEILKDETAARRKKLEKRLKNLFVD